MPQNEYPMVNISIKQNLSFNIRPISINKLNSSIPMAIKKLKNNSITKRLNKSIFIKYNK